MIANNRHHAARIKAKRKTYHFQGKTIYKTPALCSCWMCGNPRKWFGSITIQEKRLFQEGWDG